MKSNKTMLKLQKWFFSLFCCLINIHDTESLRNIKLLWTNILSIYFLNCLPSPKPELTVFTRIHAFWHSFARMSFQNTTEPIIISDAVYTGCGATRQILRVNPLFFLWRTDTKFTWFATAARHDSCRKNDQYTKHRTSCDVTIVV